MAMTFLPRFFMLKLDGKYLTIPQNLHDSQTWGFLKFDEEQILSPLVKFAVEQAETGDGRHVHIRSCYNNKYWVANGQWIAAAGEKPEEDTSKDKDCTLFEPFTSSGNRAVHLRHVQTRKTLTVKSPGHSLPSSMCLNVSLSITGTLFEVTDWETLVILPSRVSFKSEELDGNYLCSRDLDGGIFDRDHPYQTFESRLEVGDPRVAKVLIPTPDGNYRIKDAYFGKFWRRSPNWIWADGEDNNSDNDTIFSIVKIRDNVIALRNLGNNNFCGALTTEGKTNCLNASYPAITRETRLMIEEPVLRRTISDVSYRLSDSRIYQNVIQEVASVDQTNNDPEHESKVTLSYKVLDSKTNHWTNSQSIKSGVSVSLSTDIIPYITEGKVEVSKEVGYSYEWGVSKTTEVSRETSTVAVVAPLKKIKVSLMSKKANCDVPFSYTQHDLLTTGEEVTTHNVDGIYTGISYSFHFTTEEVTN